MTQTSAPALLPETPHLFAAAAALALAFAILAGGYFWGTQLERRSIHAFAPEPFSLKNQGLALQAEALRHPDILPLYGSSELVKPIPDKASIFFKNEPTGFQISPVGKAGTTSLIIAQKLAALEPDLRGKKIALSISPGWFFIEVLNPRYYAGNFSLLAASEMIFSDKVSLALRRDTARRMLQFPRTLADSALLETALHALDSDTLWSHTLYHVLMPLGWTENGILRLQDHFETILYILQQRPKTEPNEKIAAAPDWPALLAEVDKQSGAAAETEEPGAEAGPGPDDESLKSGGSRLFLEKLSHAREWIDFELLLRTLREIGAKPLLLSMPVDGVFYDHAGVPRAARDAYYGKIHELAQRYDLPVLAFEKRDEDESFLNGHHDHLSAKGWMHYNKTLDDFFHDRLTTSDFSAR